MCKVIAEDKKAKRKSKYGSSKSHAINVLDRADNTIKVLDKGNKIFGQLAIYLQQMGDLKGYDVSIVRTGENFGEINYTVVPVFPPTPLTDTEKAMEQYDLEEITKPFTMEEILKFMQGATIEDVVGAREGNDSTPFDATPQTPQAQAPTGLNVDFTQQA